MLQHFSETTGPQRLVYGLLAGIRTTMLSVTAHAIKGMAAGAVALVGLLPIYVAVALTSIVFPLGTSWDWMCAVWGLALPFLAGIRCRCVPRWTAWCRHAFHQPGLPPSAPRWVASINAACSYTARIKSSDCCVEAKRSSQRSRVKTVAIRDLARKAA